MSQFSGETSPLCFDNIIIGIECLEYTLTHMYILALEVQPEEGSSCTSRNMLLEDMIENTFQ
jgi:hypothetical protein